MFSSLPEDILHVIFLHLDFVDKVTAGLVCTRWDKVLRGKLSGKAHWDVWYNLDSNCSAPTILFSPKQTPLEQALTWNSR